MFGLRAVNQSWEKCEIFLKFQGASYYFFILLTNIFFSGIMSSIIDYTRPHFSLMVRNVVTE